MLEPLALPFMQRALVGGILVGLLAGYYGVFVVQRRLAFLGSGLAHAAFGGVALGILLDAQPLWIALPFTIAVALGMVWVRETADIAADTTIGIFFSVSMALGVIFLSLKNGFTGDAFVYLFGSILYVQTTDILLAAAVLLLTLLLLPMWSRWAYATFDPVLARADRLPVARDDYLLTVCIAVTVVVALKVVGMVLIAAFLVLPPAAARLLARTFLQMTLLSLLLSATTVAAGLLLSFHTDLPSGPTIILLQAAVFFAALMLHRIRS
jgi:zinc transport system permease protein